MDFLKLEGQIIMEEEGTMNLNWEVWTFQC